MTFLALLQPWQEVTIIKTGVNWWCWTDVIINYIITWSCKICSWRKRKLFNNFYYGWPATDHLHGPAWHSPVKNRRTFTDMHTHRHTSKHCLKEWRKLTRNWSEKDRRQACNRVRKCTMLPCVFLHTGRKQCHTCGRHAEANSTINRVWRMTV